MGDGPPRDPADYSGLQDAFERILQESLDNHFDLTDIDRGSLSMYWSGLLERHGRTSEEVLLRVELKDLSYLKADDAGLVGHALQLATALMGAHLNHREEVWRLHERDRQRVPLMQVRQQRNVLWYASVPAVDAQLPLDGAGAADFAVQELLDYLPSHGDAQAAVDRAVDGALGAEQSVRRAIDALAGIGTRTHSAVGLSVEKASGSPAGGQPRELSVDVAQRLHQDLLPAKERTTEETWVGAVDGMRMGKRVAWILSEGAAANVSFENHQARLVHGLIGHRVRAQVLVRHVRTATTVRERRYYRLLSLESLGEMLPGMSSGLHPDGSAPEDG